MVEKTFTYSKTETKKREQKQSFVNICCLIYYFDSNTTSYKIKVIR